MQPYIIPPGRNREREGGSRRSAANMIDGTEKWYAYTLKIIFVKATTVIGIAKTLGRF